MARKLQKPKHEPEVEAKRGRGRPSDYKPEYAVTAAKLCALGATDVDIADIIGVSDRTVYRWSAAHPEFCHALKAGKAAVDDRVERALYHKAVGYSFDTEKIFQSGGDIIRAKTRVHVPPDTTAAIFWLKNRRKDEWRDKTVADVNVKNEDAQSPEFLEMVRRLNEFARQKRMTIEQQPERND